MVAILCHYRLIPGSPSESDVSVRDEHDVQLFTITILSLAVIVIRTVVMVITAATVVVIIVARTIII
jgi:hypothetical protein